MRYATGFAASFRLLALTCAVTYYLAGSRGANAFVINGVQANQQAFKESNPLNIDKKCSAVLMSVAVSSQRDLEPVPERITLALSTLLVRIHPFNRVLRKHQHV
jgi:hypothetical protein